MNGGIDITDQLNSYNKSIVAKQQQNTKPTTQKTVYNPSQHGVVSNGLQDLHSLFGGIPRLANQIVQDNPMTEGNNAVAGAVKGAYDAAKSGNNILKGAVKGGTQPLVKGSQDVINMAKGTAKEYSDLATHPVQHVLQHPVNSVLDLLPFVDPASELLSGGSDAAKAGEAGEVAAESPKSNGLQRNAESLQNSVLNQKLPRGSFVSGEGEAPLLQYAKENNLLTPFDNAKSVLNKLGSHYQDLKSQIGGILDTDKTFTPLKEVQDAVRSSIGDSNSIGVKDPARSGLIDDINGKLAELAEPNSGNLTAEDLYKYKNDIQDAMGTAFEKASKGGTLSPKEAIYKDARDAINRQLPDSVRELSGRQSKLYDLEPGLKNSASKAIRTGGGISGAPRIPSTGLSNLFQSAKTGIAGAEEGVGNAVSGISNTARSLLGGLTSLPASAVLQGARQQGSELPATTTEAPPQTVGEQPDLSHGLDDLTQQSPEAASSPSGLKSNDIQKVMIADLANNGGKNLSKLNTLYSIVKSQEDANQPPKLTAAASGYLDNATSALKGVSAIQDAFSHTGETGKGALSSLLGSKVLGVGVPGGGGIRDINTAVQESLPNVAKALGYGTSASELKLVQDMLPTSSDNQKIASQKLQQIADNISEYAHKFVSNRNSYVANSQGDYAQLPSYSAATQ